LASNNDIHNLVATIPIAVEDQDSKESKEQIEQE